MTRPISRRQFVAGAAGLQLGVFVSRIDGQFFVAAPDHANQEAEPSGLAQSGDSEALGVWVRVAPEGEIGIYVAKPDIGQGVRTSLAMIVAEDLEASWDDVVVLQAPASSAFGSQGVGGSGSVIRSYDPLRRAGASAKQMLINAAATQWGVPAGECEARDSAVHHAGSGRSLSYGELAEAASGLPVPPANSVQLKARSEFKLIGNDTQRVDNADVVRGTATFGIDARPEGLRFAVVARPPAIGAQLRSYNEEAARAVPGVLEIIPQFSGGVAVVATNTWSALQGRDALSCNFDPSVFEGLSSDSIHEDLVQRAGSPPDLPGSADSGVDAAFDLPFLAHACMEPMNCTVEWDGETATAWAPCQNPQGVQRTVSAGLGIDQDRVTVHATLAGGGYGRRASTDYASEAAILARFLGPGAVQVLWTREDDIKFDAFRPASHHVMRGGLASDGEPVAWSHKMAIVSRGRGDLAASADAKRQDRQAEIQQGNGLYAIPGYGVETIRVGQVVPTMVWRSVNNSQVNFANECFVDMLAVESGVDPYAFRAEHMNSGRMAPLLDKAAEMIGWGRDLPAGRGLGIACFSGYGSLVSQAAEVEVSPQGQVKVIKVVCAVDCGLAINPLSVRAQMEGCVADAVSTTLKSQITVDEGAIQQDNFWDFEWIRIEDMPEVEVWITESDRSPGGMGEVGYPAVSPAICNAIFAATGRRIHRLPLRTEDLEGWAGDVAPEPTPAPPEPTAVPNESSEIYLPNLRNGAGG